MENSERKRQEGILSIVSIHAAILSIFFTAISAFAIYSYERLQNLEMEAIQTAEQINQIYFARSTYYPKGFDRTDIAVENMRSTHGLNKPQPEAKNSVIHEVRTEEDIKELFRYLYFLVNRLDPDLPGTNIGKVKFIPRDSANRGEEILKVLNVLGHSYLFPEAPSESDLYFKPGMSEKKYFKGMTALRDWLRSINAFVEGSKYLRFFLAGNELGFPDDGGVSPYLKALKTRDKILIERWDKSPMLRSYGHREPIYLFNDFLDKARKVEKIADDTQYQINRLDIARESGLLIYALYGVFWVGLLFLSGVFCPLLWPKTPKVFYIYFPLISYISMVCVMTIFLWRIVVK